MRQSPAKSVLTNIGQCTLTKLWSNKKQWWWSSTLIQHFFCISALTSIVPRTVRIAKLTSHPTSQLYQSIAKRSVPIMELTVCDWYKQSAQWWLTATTTTLIERQKTESTWKSRQRATWREREKESSWEKRAAFNKGTAKAAMHLLKTLFRLKENRQPWPEMS